MHQNEMQQNCIVVIDTAKGLWLMIKQTHHPYPVWVQLAADDMTSVNVHSATSRSQTPFDTASPMQYSTDPNTQNTVTSSLQIHLDDLYLSCDANLTLFTKKYASLGCQACCSCLNRAICIAKFMNESMH